MGKRLNHYQYYVEGESEKALINALKLGPDALLISGKVSVFNVVQNRIEDMRLRALEPDTIVILVFDTDTSNADMLRENIKKLKGSNHVVGIWCVAQVNNFEDELVYSTDISSVKELTGSKSKKDFKRDFQKEKDVKAKLMQYNFSIEKLWSRLPDNPFAEFGNDGEKVKKQK